MDREFESVNYLEEEKAYACTFKDKKKFFLKRSDVLDNVDRQSDLEKLLQLRR